ncbi:MAG TPA: DNA-directed RNA polymerase subunit omega [Vicinamibacterales bacterium]|jgi:DNA-directed RNA polymerase subunit K/omega
MTDETLTHDQEAAEQSSEPAAAIDSRFLFVDVAAQRANQLRRGARIRLTTADGRHLPHKLERAAMEEVRQQLVHYSLPDTPSSRQQQK